MAALDQHQLRVSTSPGGPVIMCLRCGGYAHRRMCLLGDTCRGKASTGGAAHRLGRFLSGQHPTQDVLLGAAWKPPVSVVSVLLGRVGRAIPAKIAACDDALSGAQYRQAVLWAIGLTEEDLAVLVAENAQQG